MQTCQAEIARLAKPSKCIAIWLRIETTDGTYSVCKLAREHHQKDKAVMFHRFMRQELSSRFSCFGFIWYTDQLEDDTKVWSNFKMHRDAHLLQGNNDTLGKQMIL